MKRTELDALESGAVYKVRISGGLRAVRRVFMWNEMRFGDIPCAVFTSRVGRNARARNVGTVRNPNRVTIAGNRYIGLRTLSVPAYDLLAAEKVRAPDMTLEALTVSGQEDDAS